MSTTAVEDLKQHEADSIRRGRKFVDLMMGYWPPTPNRKWTTVQQNAYAEALGQALHGIDATAVLTKIKEWYRENPRFPPSIQSLRNAIWRDHDKPLAVPVASGSTFDLHEAERVRQGLTGLVLEEMGLALSSIMDLSPYCYRLMETWLQPNSFRHVVCWLWHFEGGSATASMALHAAACYRVSDPSRNNRWYRGVVHTYTKRIDRVRVAFDSKYGEGAYREYHRDLVAAVRP